MNTILLTGILIIFGSFIIGYVVAPTFLIFSKSYALVFYIISWILFCIGSIIGGKIAYRVSIRKIKQFLKK